MATPTCSLCRSILLRIQVQISDVSKAHLKLIRPSDGQTKRRGCSAEGTVRHVDARGDMWVVFSRTRLMDGTNGYAPQKVRLERRTRV